MPLSLLSRSSATASPPPPAGEGQGGGTTNSVLARNPPPPPPPPAGGGRATPPPQAGEGAVHPSRKKQRNEFDSGVHTMKVGFIGTGRMGGAMVGRLLAA